MNRVLATALTVMVGVGHAVWHLRTELMEEQATVMARKFAEEMRKPPAIS